MSFSFPFYLSLIWTPVFCMNQQSTHLYSLKQLVSSTLIRISNGLKESDLPITSLLLQHGIVHLFLLKLICPQQLAINLTFTVLLSTLECIDS